MRSREEERGRVTPFLHKPANRFQNAEAAGIISVFQGLSTVLVDHERVSPLMTSHSDRPAGPSSGPTDATSLSLLQRVKTRDADAWRRMVELYSPLVYSWCRRSGMNGEDAGDVLQDVFTAVAVHIDDFRRDRAGDTFRGWLRTIARNKIRDHFRRQAQQPAGIGGSTAQQRFQDLADEHLEPTDAASEDEESRGLFHRALELIRSDFEEHTWKAFWQTAVEGRTSTDVADDLGMTPGAVRQAKYKVLRRLRTELGDVLKGPRSIEW